MAEGDSSKPVASVRSLLNWLNTFDLPEVQCISKLEDLSSGDYLLKCLKSVMPETVCDEGENSSSENGPLDELWRVMEEFYQCPLDKSLSVKELLSGNQEHIARVVVLLLCMMAVSKENGQVIEKIKSLEDSDQRDIMFYIQNTLAAMSTSAIANGDMTSGIGEPLPELEEHISPSSLSQPSSPMGCATPISISRPLKLSYSTPRVPSKINLLKSAEVLSLLNTPAVNKMFNSPAVIKPHPLAKAQASSPTTFSSSSPMTRPTPFKLSTEVPRLRHRISVLEGMVETHRKNSHDYYSDFCTKAEAYESLLTEKNQLEEKLGHLGELRDVQDELDQANLNLSKAKKSMDRLRSENESLCGYREQVVELEAKLKDYDLAHSKLHEYKEKVDKMSLTVSEKTSALNELNVAHQTIKAQLQGKTTELENLLTQNRETSREIKELNQKCRGLEGDRTELEFCLEKKTESEQNLTSSNRELQTQLEAAQGEVTTAQRQKETLEEQLKSVEADYTSYRRHVEGTLQDVQKENESLRVKCSMKDGEIESETMEKQMLSEKLARLEKERLELQEVLKQLQTDMGDKISSLSQEKECLSSNLAARESSLAQQTSEIATTERQVTSLTKAVEEMKAQLVSKEEELSTLFTGRDNLEKDLTQLRGDLSRAIDRCETKESALSLCKAELNEKDGLIMALSSEKLELLGQLDSLQTNVEVMNTKHNCLVQDIDDLRQENGSIARELDVIIAENSKVERSRFQLQESNEELSSQVVKLQAEIVEGKTTIALKDNFVSALSDDKADLEQQLTRLQADYDQLSKKTEAVGEEIKSQLEAKEERAKALEVENTSLLQQIKELESCKEDVETKVAHLENDLSEKEKEITVLASSIQDGLEEQISELQQKLNEKEAEIEQQSRSWDTLKHQLSSMEDNISYLESEKKVLEDEKRTLQDDKKVLEDEVNVFRNEKEVLEEQKKVLENEKKELESSYQSKREDDEAKVRKCHELVAEFKATVEQMRESLEERNNENASLQSSLVQSQKEVTDIREKSEVAAKQFEEERGRMKEEIIHLEERLEKQQQESKDQWQQLSSELELSQQKYASELEHLNQQNKALQMQQDEIYCKLRDENIETLRKQNKLYEEVDKLREREQEATALCREYKVALEKERESVMSANNHVEQLQDELEHYEGEKVSEVEQLQQELDRLKYQLLKEQRQAVSEKNTLMAQLSYASEKLRSLEKSNQLSPPPSRQSSRFVKNERPVRRTSSRSSTISSFSASGRESQRYKVDLESQIQSEFDRFGSQSVIPTDHSQDEDVTLTFRSSSPHSLATSESWDSLGSLPPSQADHSGGAGSRSSVFLDGKYEKKGYRISELQRRNARALPHLKSSYPIETQTQRESPSVCDESIKNGSKTSKQNTRQETISSSVSQISMRKPVAFEVELQPDPSISSVTISGERKRARVNDSSDNAMRSPAPKSLRLVNDACTPPSSTDNLHRSSTFTKEVQQSNRLTAGLKLRDYLDKPAPQDDQSKQGMAFVVSPPKTKVKGQLPKRLQENLSQRRSTVSKPQSVVRRATIVKGKSATTTKASSSAATARRNALKSKN